jgi:hypothetical protein
MSYKDDYIQSEFFSLVSIHSIKFKLELTSINVLLLNAYASPLLIITFLYYEANKIFYSLSLTHSLRSKYNDISLRKSRANISLLYTDTHKRFLVLVLAYSFVAHIHLFNNNDNSFTRYYLDFTLFLLLLSIFIIIYIYIY